MQTMLKNCANKISRGRCTVIALAVVVTLMSGLLAACSKSPGDPPNILVRTKGFGLSAYALDSAVILNWPRINDAKKYNLYWSLTSGVTKWNGTKIADVSAPFEHTGLSNGTPVYYIYTVETSAGEGAASQEITLVPGINAAGSPYYVEASGRSERVELFWCCVANATSYNIYGKTSHGDPFGDPILEDATSPAVITLLQNNQSYYFAVTAVVNGVESPVSNETVAATYAPETFTLTAGEVPNTPHHTNTFTGHQQITIGADNQNDALRYTIYWNTTGDVTETSEHISNVALPYTHLELTNGTKYFYRVAASNQHGNSALSPEISNVPNNDKISDIATGIADANLRSCIEKSALNYGWIFRRQLSQLDCYDQPTLDLAGLDQFSNLRYVYLSHPNVVVSALTGLDTLTHLANLNELDLLGNGVSDVSFLTGLMNLTYLDLRKNNITDAQLIALKELTEQHLLDLNALGISTNPITSLTPLESFHNLETLYLDGLQISDYSPLAQLTKLQEISLAGNAISDLAPLASTLGKLNDLRKLYLQDNPFSDLSPLATFNQLTALWVGHDPDDLDSSHRITSLEPLRNLKALTDLRFENNAINGTGLNPLADHMNLQVLMFDNNQVDLLTALNGLKKLQTLSAGKNQITSAHLEGISALTNLEFLTLNKNLLVSVDALAGLTRVRELALQENAIVDVAPLTGMTQLTTLNLNSNLIEDVSPLANLTALSWLDLSNNRIGANGPGWVNRLDALTQVGYLGLGGNGTTLSCAELDLLFTHLGAPSPVDLDGNSATVDTFSPPPNPYCI